MPVAMNPALLTSTESVLNLAGTFAFGLSGALLGVRKNFDVVGMTVLAEATALGGGVLRDLVIGATPPAAFQNPVYLVLPAVAVAVAFFAHEQVNRIRMAVLVFDAVGLALFAVAGAAKALAYGLGPIPAVFLGAITGVGGGITRDVLANDRPAVLRAGSELYTVPAVLGATIVVVAAEAGAYGALWATVATVATLALRLAAMRRGWHAPQPRRSGRVHPRPDGR